MCGLKVQHSISRRCWSARMSTVCHRACQAEATESLENPFVRDDRGRKHQSVLSLLPVGTPSTHAVALGRARALGSGWPASAFRSWGRTCPPICCCYCCQPSASYLAGNPSFAESQRRVSNLTQYVIASKNTVILLLFWHESFFVKT